MISVFFELFKVHMWYVFLNKNHHSESRRRHILTGTDILDIEIQTTNENQANWLVHESRSKMANTNQPTSTRAENLFMSNESQARNMSVCSQEIVQEHSSFKRLREKDNQGEEFIIT